MRRRDAGLSGVVAGRSFLESIMVQGTERRRYHADV